MECNGRSTAGCVTVPVNIQLCGDEGINHLPINSGVILLDSPWLPLHMYVCMYV